MIWHIFKKDLRMTWKIALAAALVQWVDTAMVIAMGATGDSVGAGTAAARLEPLRQVVHVLAFVAVGLAAVAAVQNDSLPAPTDDWLVRPIRRIDMMLAKVLFFLVAIAGPIFLGSLAVSVGLGFGFSEAIYGAALHACATAIWLGLFSLGLGAVTSNVVEALLGGFACLVLFALILFTGNAMRSAAWYGDDHAVIYGGLTAGIAISGLLAFVSQFHRRKTRRSRAIALTVFVAGAAVSLLPTGAAKALAAGVSQVSPVAWRIKLVLDPPGGRQSFQTQSGINTDFWVPTGINGDHDLSWLTFRVTGLRSGETLVAQPWDANTAVVTDEAGTVSLRSPLEVDNHGFVWLGIHGNKRRNLQHSVSVAVTYSFAVVRETGTYPITATGESLRVPGGLGLCTMHYATGSSGNGALSCFSPLPDSACFELSDKRDEQIRFPCSHNASSTLSWLWDWNALPQSGGSIYEALPGSTLFLHAYEHYGYVTGQLDLPNVQPGDWIVPPQKE